MRTAMPRIAAVVIAMLAFSPTPASAENWASCGPDSQNIIEPTNIDGSFPNGVIMDDGPGDSKIVCYSVAFARAGSGAIIVDPVSGGTPPGVIVGTDLGTCPGDPLFSNSTLHLAVNLSTATVCFAIQGNPKTLSFTAGGGYQLPRIEVWRNGDFSALDVAACPVAYAQYQFGEGGTACMNGGPQRIL